MEHGQVQEVVPHLQRQALQVRRNILRLIRAGKAGHAGGSLSAADIVTALYFHVMTIDPVQPQWPERDRFVLSAGHKCMVLYSALAARGYFPEELLDTYVSLGSKLPGHPDMKKLPGVEASTGALGHGLSIAGGMALGLRLSGLKSRVFVLMGDGEQAEGSVWEAAAAASHHRLDNMVGIVDRNGLQISGPTVKVMSYEPLEERWKSFGWEVRRIDGHDFPAILDALQGAPFAAGKPSMIVADTIKAKGLSFAEGKVDYHYWKPGPAELEQAQKDLDAIERTLRK
jgi:transketolase